MVHTVIRAFDFLRRHTKKNRTKRRVRPPNAPPNPLPNPNFLRSHLSLRLASPAPLGVVRGLTMLPPSPPSSPSWSVGDVS
ncbi:hypothetical protein YC2023_052105 [Brassica napus]